jgi:hypothetical protein
MIIAGAQVKTDSPLMPLGILIVCVSATVFLVRIARWFARKLFYRLSWRLAFSYFLIGVLPIPMVAVLIAIAADMTVGQFETFRVNEALRELGAQILAGRLPGVRTATVAAEKVTASSIPLLEPGSPAPGWLRKLEQPRFHRRRTAGVLRDRRGVRAVRDRLRRARGRPSMPACRDLGSRAAAPVRRSRARSPARSDTSREPACTSSWMTTRSPAESSAQRRRRARVHLSPAVAEDRRAPFRVVWWLYTSRPVLGLDRRRPGDARGLHEASWNRALGELFERQGAIEAANPLADHRADGGRRIAARRLSDRPFSPRISSSGRSPRPSTG